jgi:hypothetical protein
MPHALVHSLTVFELIKQKWANVRELLYYVYISDLRKFMSDLRI